MPEIISLLHEAADEMETLRNFANQQAWDAIISRLRDKANNLK